VNHVRLVFSQAFHAGMGLDALHPRLKLDSSTHRDAGAALAHPAYRADIDGLRAVAVLAVVAFHAFPGRLSGGFVGVDIFFVISGFLISSILFSNLERDSFSLLEFYRRRIRRIFPALLVVLIASFAFGWIVLLADEYRELGKHIAGGAGFVSNVILWSESGYFDGAIDTKPLAHLWSLGVEEQFYLVWPLLLLLVWNRHWNFLRTTLLIGLFSFALNVWLLQVDASADFYSLFSRFWELMIGGVVAYVALHRAQWISRYRNLQANIGAALIGIALVAINQNCGFPGWWAAVPVLGGSLLICAGTESWFNRRILANPAAVWIGAISYPLYLWHWPLLSFARIINGSEPARTARIAAVLAAVVLAWLTTRLIEAPVRRGGRGSAKSAILLCGMLLVGVAGWACSSDGGFRSARYTAGDIFLFNRQQLRWTNYKSPDCSALLRTDSAFCMVFGNATAIRAAVIGDSTGNALAPGLAELYADRDHGLVNFGSDGCPPIRGITSPWVTNCPSVVAHSYDWIRHSKTLQTAVLAIYAPDLPLWGIPGVSHSAALDKRVAALKPLLDRDIAELRRRGLAVIVTYDAPQSPVAPRDCLARPLGALNRRSCETPESQLVGRLTYLRYFDALFANRPGVCVFRQSQLLINAGRLTLFDTTGRLMLRDPHHLSEYGSERMAQIFRKSRCYQPAGNPDEAYRESASRRTRDSESRP
jgi:peptidoglycan/LPS O-acetylase OafA/YrhL